MIDERLDVVVWLTTLTLFVLLGARAWAIETAEARIYRTSARVRVLNASVGVALVALVGLMAMQGGTTLVQAIITDTDPRDLVTFADDVPATDPNAPPADPNAPPADPGAPPADPAAPPADPNAPPADPNAPPAAPGP